MDGTGLAPCLMVSFGVGVSKFGTWVSALEYCLDL